MKANIAGFILLPSNQVMQKLLRGRTKKKPKRKKQFLRYQKEENKKYNKMKRQRRKRTNQRCEIKIKGVCIGKPVHPHHKKGRIGELLYDSKYIIDACDPCNGWVNDHPKEAMAMGFIVSRLKKEELLDEKESA
jgi:hypothetical protein